MGNTVDDTAGNTVGYTAGRRRLDLKEAAAELGVTSEAIRRRAKRGTLPSEKGEDGRLYVWVPDVSDADPHGGGHGVSDDRPHGGVHDQDQDTRAPDVLLERFEDENDFLRRELERLHRELERKDAILLTMAQRIPELEPAREASPEATGEPVSHSNNGSNGDDVPPEQEERRSWWRRLLEG
jgi:hypothetical protein